MSDRIVDGDFDDESQDHWLSPRVAWSILLAALAGIALVAALLL